MSGTSSLRARIAGAFHPAPPPPLAPPGHYPPAEVAEMLREIGIAMVEASYPVQLVEQRLREIAARYTTARVQVAVLPTMLYIQVGDRHELEGSARPSSQLDKTARVDEIAGLAAAGAISPADAVAQARAARRQPPRFGALTTTLGYALATVGFGMVIQPTWKALLAHAFLGLVVGLIIQVSRPLPNLGAIVPALSAVVVTLLATWFLADVADDGLLRIISPALVALLPGSVLVIGAIELAGGRIVAGASRTVYGLVQLGLMIYGVAVGVRIAGHVPPQPSSALMGNWSLYVSIVVIAVGYYFGQSAPRGALIWLVLVIGIAMLGQVLASKVLSSEYAGFFGAMLVIPFAVLASGVKGAPPASVLALAAFWALVPGQLTFMSFSQSASGDFTGVAGATVAGEAVLSIALGTLVGWYLVRTFDVRRRRRRRQLTGSPVESTMPARFEPEEKRDNRT